jgi:hypothetical protein
MHISVRDMREGHRKFLWFKWNNQIFQFKVVPFGLASAPCVFSKVLAPIAAHVLTQGAHVFPYLCDWLMQPGSLVRGNTDFNLVSSTLVKACWLINWGKSNPDPAQERTFIGVQFRTGLNLVCLPSDRIDSILDCVLAILGQASVKVRFYLRLLGLMAATLEVVQYARLFMSPSSFTCSCWPVGCRNPRTEALTPVGSTSIHHLKWWRSRENLPMGYAVDSTRI